MTNADRYNLSPDSLERARRIIDILRADFALAPGHRLVIGVHLVRIELQPPQQIRFIGQTDPHERTTIAFWTIDQRWR